MKGKNRTAANVILVFFAIVFLISYPFKDFFIGGLISGGSLAAFIGGLADFFGITAIFKKPLGINWPKKIFRTDIINNNREKFINTIVDTVENDLLNKDKLKDKFKSYELSLILTIFLKSKSGDKILEKAIEELSEFIVEENHKISDVSLDILIDILKKFNLSGFLYELIKYIIASGYEDKAIDKLVNILIVNLRSKDGLELINKIYIDSMKNYEQENSSRKIVNKVFLGNIMGISDEKAAKIIQDKAIGILKDILIKNNKNRILIKNRVDFYVEKLKSDEKLIYKIENYKEKLILENENLKSFMKSIIDNYINVNSENLTAWVDILKLEKKRVLSDLIRDKDKIYKLDKLIKDIMFKTIDEKHNEIGKLVKKNLDKYNNSDITKLMQEKVEDDLQIIRINGSVVGGMVGVITYLLTFWIA